MEPLDILNSVEYLEPKCPKCSSKIKYGVTTTWDEKEEAHVCKNCGTVLK